MAERVEYESDLPVNVFEVPPEIRAELLDPVVWRSGLQQYAVATRIAVQLFDVLGTPVTECFNPQPVWTALRQTSGGSVECGFSVAHTGCRCLQQAFQQRTAVFVREVSGIVHFAVPLFLEDKVAGGLLAGQVFDQYPDMLLLERAAGTAGPTLSVQQIWDLARRTLPLGMPTLRVYSDLLITFANAILQARYQSMLEAQRLQQLRLAMETTSASLAEKEALLREVHHRVKNNLQVICSLLTLKATRVRDEDVVAMFDEMRQRILSIAAIHESLYRSDALATIDLVAKTRGLAGALAAFYATQGRVNIELTEHVPVMLPIDAAVPCGLILNELLSNSLKHAFPLKKRGTIRVLIREGERRCQIKVSDDGVGMARDFSIENTRSFGLTLVDLLVSQLGGTLDIESDSTGTIVHISFPRPRGE